MFKPLGDIALVSLGYKSLQNDFFYVNKATIDTYGIEKKYLIPILMLRDLSSEAFEQDPKPTVWLFACKDKLGDLKGTGAMRYIEAMGDRSASDKKQTGKNLTIKEALEAQSGGVWFQPKARPNKHHIWLRKAIGSVYAPFFFEKAALVDQRLNSIAPVEGVEWKELGAVLTSSIFAYSLEINGAAAMGAGALEAATTKLRDYPILDIRDLKANQRTKLVTLAQAVWKNEKPVDWGSVKWMPGKNLKALDEWLLKAAGRNVSVAQMYNDLRSACLARAFVAEDKTKKTKKQKSDSIGNVAESIVKVVNPVIRSKNFPNDFLDGVALDLPMTFDRSSLKDVSIHQLLDSYEIEVRTRAGGVAYQGTHPRPVAEGIVRALMWGRSQFAVSSDRKVMDEAVNKFLIWASKTEQDIEKAIRESAYGTGYEDALKNEVYARIGIHPLSGAKVLPPRIAF
jgi:hypothetical protein